MNASKLVSDRDGLARRIAYRVLLVAVRGRRRRGGDWGEAVLAEFPETRGTGAGMRWMVGGLRVAWRERRARVRQLPRYQRIGRRFAFTALTGGLAAFLLGQFVLTPTYMPSGSMEPTLRIGDRYLVDKVAFRMTGIHRNDIVTVEVRQPDLTPESRRFVKRVVGLPGDTLTCRDGAVLRNGTVIARRRVDGDSSIPVSCEEITVPKDHVYVLGDFLDVSLDSRQLGPIPQKDVVGRVVARIWPTIG